MSGAGKVDISALSMRELLCMEVAGQSRVLIDNLLEIEQGELNDKHLESVMRAAHSVKGGARIADLSPAVELAHVMEDMFVAARAGTLKIRRVQVDVLLLAVDMLTELAQAGARHEQLPDELAERAAALRKSLIALSKPSEVNSRPDAVPAAVNEHNTPQPETAAHPPPAATGRNAPEPDATRTARVSVASMNRLMTLVGELSVKGNVTGLAQQTQQARRQIREIQAGLEGLQRHLRPLLSGDLWLNELKDLSNKIEVVGEFLGAASGELETHNGQLAGITRQMQREVIAHRMQPFGNLAQGLRLLVRRLEQSLQKKLVLEINGLEVGVDRDILERLNAPLTHLIQNAADHGIESAQQRAAHNKPTNGKITLSAQHRGGMLSIVVEDDGCGIDTELLRLTVAGKQLVSGQVAASLQENELLEFLFLPNFTMRQQVSDISGRGVGLDLVRHTLQEVRGTVRMSTRLGKGTRFEMTLPVTMIVMRCLIVRIAGELFAMPLGRIASTLRVSREDVLSLENRQYLLLEGHQVGLVSAAQLLELQEYEPPQMLDVVVLAQGRTRYGLVVDKLLGERKLVERPLDARFGKLEDISSMSVLEDGSPVFILDMDDVLHSIERLASGRLSKVGIEQGNARLQQSKRVLVVDDSITVREVERGLLNMQGYAVEVAVDGAEGWNALRTAHFDLLVTDVDMPRMDGVELVRQVRKDARLKHLPVIIISYKDREEDRMKGLDAGADRYLTKGSFQDESFVQTVAELLGQSSGELDV